MSDVNKEFGDYLKELRLARKESDPTFSLRGLAERVKLSVPYLSKIERGEIPASNETVYRLAEALGVSADELFFRASKIEPELCKTLTSEHSGAMVAFLRTASKLPPDKLEMYRNVIISTEDKLPSLIAAEKKNGKKI